MKRYLLFLFIICFNVQLQAQKAEAYLVDEQMNWWNLKLNDEAIVFADVAYIRDYPSTNALLLDSLKNGDRVQIISEGYNPSTIRGFHAPWHKIRYQTNGKIKEGFIWLGLLALGKETNESGELFMYGFLRKNKETYNDNGSYLLELKSLDMFSNLLSRVYYPAYLYEQTFVESKVFDNMGLEGLKSIHRIAFLGEACGISSNYYYFGWNGKKLIPLFEKTTVSDAGIFYYEERILFPSEHNLDNSLIIKDIEQGEAIDENAEEIKYKIKKERKKYRWNGNTIAEIIELK